MSFKLKKDDESYLTISEKPQQEYSYSRELADNIYVDYDKNGNAIGIKFLELIEIEETL